MKFLRILVFFMLLVTAAEAVMAGQGHTSLLATTEPFKGGVSADLFLETKPGSGKIFIESYQLTKIDTQISTRFAKEVACSYAGEDCNGIDFFYAIKADAVIIGGPSAGASIAALTVAVLEGAELNKSVAITGTINSGNVIGHVGGISEKIEAARNAGIKKVLIPAGERSYEIDNRTTDLIRYGEELGVEVIEVFSLDEAMKEFTGKTFKPDNSDIEVNQKYRDVMSGLASRLCARTEELSGKENSEVNESFDELKSIAKNLSRQGAVAREEESYYAAASFCFGANVRYKFLELFSKELSNEMTLSGLENVNRQVGEFENSLEKASTVSDAQILAVVLDRLGEARLHTNLSAAYLNEKRLENGIYELAFAIERLESARAWSDFLGVMKDAAIQEEALKNACTSKLAEAQERIEYATILVRSSSDSARKVLGEAQRFSEEEDYVQCLHKATLSKSQANTILSVFGTRDEEIQDIGDRKIDAARTSISRQKGIFPIVGYSYYEYANSLKETDKYSALLFSDYALEFSDIGIYFRPDNETAEEDYEIKTAPPSPPYFIDGFLAGIALSAVLLRLAKKKKK